MIDEKGRCCGRKPIIYKAGYAYNPLRWDYFYCDRCGNRYEAVSPFRRLNGSITLKAQLDGKK
jgi:hypothetical protein